MMVTRAHTSTDVSPRGDLPSGCFSNYNWPPPLAIEVVDAKRQIHRAFARPAAGRRDRGEMRWRPSEVDLGGGRAADSLMRAEVRVVELAFEPVEVKCSLLVLGRWRARPGPRALVSHNRTEQPMRLPAGTKLGPYEILDPLGAGGMGDVYRASDSRLGREVAVDRK